MNHHTLQLASKTEWLHEAMAMDEALGNGPRTARETNIALIQHKQKRQGRKKMGGGRREKRD